MRAANDARAHGNEAFRSGDYTTALAAYQDALQCASQTSTPATLAPANVLRLACLSNASACHLKRSEWVEAREAASEALTVNGGHVKALYRRAAAALELGDAAAAVVDLRRAHDVDPSDLDVVSKLGVALVAEAGHTRAA